MTIRMAQIEDCTHLAILDKQCNPSPWSATQFESCLKNHLNTLLIQQINENITGFIVWQSIGDESELHLIATLPEYRRQGLASTLLQKWFQTAQTQNITRLFLEVRASNKAAQHLYHKYGFQEYNRRKNYYSSTNGTNEDAILMEKSC